MKQSKRTLDGLVAAIRGAEAQAVKKRVVRDRLFAQAREAALEVAALTEQGAGLREVLGSLDQEVYEQALGGPYTGDSITGRIEPSREQLLADLRDLLAFLDATPEIPVSREYWGIDLPRYQSDVERVAAIDALAAILGEDPERKRRYGGEDKQEYGVSRSFGHVTLYADVVVDREPDVSAADASAEVHQADADAVAGCSGEVLDERMLGMGESAQDRSASREPTRSRRAHTPGAAQPDTCFTCGKPVAENGGFCLLAEEVDQTIEMLDALAADNAEDSGGGQVMHAAAYAGPHFGLESAHALCGGKGWLTEDVSLVTCTACAALLLGDAVEENADGGAQGAATQRVVDAYLEGQSEVDQALVQEELERQAETESQPCPQCGGSGLHADGIDVGSGDEPVVCERCGGFGTIPRGGYCADCGKRCERVIPCVNQDGERFTLCPDCVESRSGGAYATADNTGDVEITSAVTA